MTSALATLLAMNAVLALVLFAIVWAVCVHVKNYGFLDVTWTLSIGLLGLVDAMLGTGNTERRVLFTGVGLAWSLRLGLFVFARVLHHHPSEDKRYRSLREQWKTPAAFLVFFELQAVFAVIFAAPFLLAAVAPNAPIALIEWLGLGLAVVGIVGEAIADAQSQAFKRIRNANTRILDTGLWRYSRHPNYFFEIVVWIGFALAALALRWGWVALACPVLITYFLLRVTGVPLTEKHSIETHGDEYRQYQRKTNRLIPWFPR
jgi:steroid 5-alpha reductase family enzyme